VGAVSKRDLWEGVAAALRTSIDEGEYRPGDTIPTEAKLASRHRVSRDTVRRALDKLTHDGLLTPGRGRLGRQVRESKPLIIYAVRSESTGRADERRAKGVDAWVADVAEQGREGGQQISVAIDEAPPEVACRLDIPEGEPVAVRQRLRTVDGSPHNINDTYYPYDIAEGTPIMHPADVTQGVIALMRDLGYVQVRYRDDLETRMPTPEEAERLQIPPGVPVLVQYRTGYAKDRPVKLTITVWPGDRLLLVYDFPA
jgi:GntR family transcriptional regulator